MGKVNAAQAAKTKLQRLSYSPPSTKRRGWHHEQTTSVAELALAEQTLEGLSQAALIVPHQAKCACALWYNPAEVCLD